MNISTKYILNMCEVIKRLSCEITDLIPHNVDEINGISKGFLVKYIDDISKKYKIFHDIIFDPPPYN
jgi:oligoribonuclease NrnB/cAMP/cGMP phosphodiesterase (DHH superfamily)